MRNEHECPRCRSSRVRKQVLSWSCDNCDWSGQEPPPALKVWQTVFVLEDAGERQGANRWAFFGYRVVSWDEERVVLCPYYRGDLFSVRREEVYLTAEEAEAACRRKEREGAGDGN